MNIWGITHKGVIREENQDAYAYEMLPDNRMIAIVCDGMGGAKAGNIASNLAVTTFMAEFLREDAPVGEPDEKKIERAADCANHAVFYRARTDFDCNGMGTTLVAALVGGEHAVVLNEGDSRAYHICESEIHQVTRDHSLVEDLVQRGELTPEQARTHPHKNLITRALGAEEKLHADLFHQEMKSGAFLLLCSDGLSNVVTEQELLFEVIHGEELNNCCTRLLNIALQRGAPDNVTVELIQY